MARELLHRSGGLLPGRQDLERLAGEIKALFLASREGRWEPVLVPEGGLYAAFPLKHLDLKQPAYREINRLLDDFYRELARRELLARKQETVNRLVRQHLSRLETKLARQQEELERAEDADAYKLKGELLLAYPHAVPRGATRVELPDPEGSGQKLAIELNPALGAVDNARAYFSRYRKAKKGLEKIRTQMEKTREEKKYWEEIRFAAGEGDAASLEEICQELEEAGYLKGKKGEGGSRKKGAPPPSPSATGPPWGIRSWWGGTTARTTTSPSSWLPGGIPGSTPRIGREGMSCLKTPLSPSGGEPGRGGPAGRLPQPRPGGERRPGGLYLRAPCAAGSRREARLCPIRSLPNHNGKYERPPAEENPGPGRAAGGGSPARRLAGAGLNRAAAGAIPGGSPRAGAP